jgi:hypothetical protein
MDVSMMWCLRWVNRTWHKVVSEFVKWHALNLVNYHNAFYHYIIAAQGSILSSACNLMFQILLVKCFNREMTFGCKSNHVWWQNVCLFLAHLIANWLNTNIYNSKMMYFDYVAWYLIMKPCNCSYKLMCMNHGNIIMLLQIKCLLTIYLHYGLTIIKT